MTNAWRSAGLAAVAAIVLAGCGDDNKNAAAAPPQVDADPLTLEIQSAVVPEFATSARPTVRFRVLNAAGAPVNLEAEMATTTVFPNTTGPRFTLAMLDEHGDYRSYYDTLRQPAAYTYDGPKPTPAARTQATAPTVTKADLKAIGGGVYEYTFPAPTVTTGLDRTKTHTVAGWISRNNGADTDAAGGSLNFVPAGGTAQKLETITDAGCNRCHGALTAHGSRRTTQLCLTCHSPQTGDPETDRTVNFKVMIHKIHSGETLPSVREGTPYFIVGNRQSIADWSDLAFPWHDHGVRHCTVCHTGKDADNWKTKPTLAVCTSCHDNVKFTAGEAPVPCPVSTSPTGTLGFTKDCIHAGGPINVPNPNDVATCQGCHGQGAANATDRYHHGD